MATSIPIRLSAALAERARAAASVLDRSLTEQVEHWARLGQIVEAAISSGSVERLKAHSYDHRLPAMLAFADTSGGRAKAAALIRHRNVTRYGISDDGAIVRIGGKGKKLRTSKQR